MWGDLFLDLLLAALVIALSPITVIAITLILSTARARANGLAFTAGWLAGLFVVTALVTLLADGAEERVDGVTTVVAAIRLLVGILLLVLAARKFMKRSAGTEETLPAWMSRIDLIVPGRALVLGLGLAAANPKNLAFALVAAAAIAGSGLTGSEELLAVLLFVGLASLSVLGSLVFYLAMTDRAASGLGRVKDFMARNNALIMGLLFAFFGVKLVIGGLTGLVG